MVDERGSREVGELLGRAGISIFAAGVGIAATEALLGGYDAIFCRFYTSCCNCIRHWFRGGYACRCWNIFYFKFHKRCYLGRIVIMKKTHNISLFIYDEAKIKINCISGDEEAYINFKGVISSFDKI